jgi:CBS domain-containing protein
MKVAQAMHSGARWIAPDVSLSEIAERMREDDVGALPVGEDDRLIGMVTDRDIVVRGLDGHADPLQLTARDVMSRPIIYCNANEELEDAVTIMESRRIRRLPVIDEHRRMVGMLSLGDVAAKASPSLSAETLRAVSAHHT